MKLTLAEQEIIDLLVEDYDVDERDARDAVAAGKALGIVAVNNVEASAEAIYSNSKCW